MKIAALLQQLSERNVSLAIENDELVILGKKQALAPSLLAELRDTKPALIEFLKLNGPITANKPVADSLDSSQLLNLAPEYVDQITAAVPGGAANVQDIYPLAPLQEGILFHHLMESKGDAYLLPYLMAFDTRERLDGFLAALQAVVDRHDILRTAMAWEGLPEPVQVVWRSAKLAIEEVVIDPEANDAAEQLSERYHPRHYRVDVRVAPLINGFTAYDPKEKRWLLLLLTHHLAIDHTTIDILLEEILMHQLGQAEQLPAPLPFRNFVAQARLGMAPEEHEAFFRGMLADVDEPTAPFGLLDVLGDGSRIQEARLTVATDLARRLRQQSRTLGISAASLFHLAWAAVLARTSGREDVVFGTVLFGRMQGGEGAGRTLGMFINTLPLRVQLAQGGVLDQVRDVQSRLAGLLRHEHAPLSLAQRCSGVQAPAPLFSALLNYRHSQAAAPADSAAAWQGIEALSAGEERTNYPIVLSVDDLGEEFTLTAQTLPPAAPERLCAMMHTALDNLITALESAPDTAMGRIGVLPEAERRQVLYDWNATRADYPQEQLLHEPFEAQAARQPDAMAVVFGDQALTYAELNIKANQLAHHLRSLDVGPDVLVAICMERSLEMVVGLVGILKAGGAYVPLDTAYPEDRLAYMLSDAAPKVLLTQEHLKKHLPATKAQVIALDRDWRKIAEQADTNLPPQSLGLNPAHLAYVIYTSGSTGQPKGVMVPHAGVMNLVSWHNRQFQVSAADRATQLAGLAFDASAWETWPYLLAGACLHLVRPEMLGQPEALWQQLADDRITVAFMPTPLAELMLAAPRPEHLALRCLLAGGDRLHGYPPAGLPFELVNNYGPTENSVVSTSCPVPAGKEGLPPIGKPIANTRVYLLDPQLEPVPVGVMGELYVGGAGLARGYLNRPELTAERFIQDPFSDEPEARLYKTGDLGRWREDGSIEFLGRNDFQVKVRGFRIELGEIEARLAEHPQVRETAVLAREDGPGDKRLVAYYTGDAELTVDSLRAHLAETLPEYMVPVAFVHLEALPLTANGKLDRKALPAPEGDAYGAREYEAPQGETEQALAAIWVELLKVDQVGRYDNFFELGGHSLLAVSLIARMRQAGLNTDVQALFAAPTLAGLAAAVGGDSRQVMVPPNGIPADATAITPDMLPLVALSQADIDRITAAVPGGAANVQDIYPLAPLQEGILFHHLMESEGDAYLLPSLLAFDNAERLQEIVVALQAVIDRHDILRTSVAWEGLPEPVQIVWRQASLSVEEVILDPEAGDAAGQLTERYHPRHYRFDVRQAPLMRVYTAYDKANDRWLLLLLMHHLVSDHTALALLMEEARAHLQGQADQLPAPLPFRNFVAQARLGISREEHEAFFRGMLADVDEPTAPFGLLDVLGDGSRIQEARLTVATDLARRLREQARTLGISAASLFHLAWAMVLSRTSGRDDVVFGTLLFGRMQGGEGGERVLGMFINTLPLRVQLAQGSVLEQVRDVQSRLAGLLRHEHAPLSLAQRCSGVQAPAPLFSALLNYRHSQDDAPADNAAAWQGIEVLLAGEERTNYPIGLDVDDLGEGFSLTAQTLPPVAPEQLCALMHTALENLITTLESAPDTAMDRIGVLPEAERRQVLYGWNATGADYPQDRCAHELFEAQALQTPDAEALVWDGGRLSYAGLNVKTNQLAHHLRSLGVKPDDRVAICAERGPDMIIGLLAILKAGGAYVPLDPAYPADRLAYMLTDSAPVVVLIQSGLAARFADCAPTVPRLLLDADPAPWAAQSGANPDPQALGLTPHHLAYVIYTSGSTGQPKGVMIEHQSLVNYALGAAEVFGLTGTDTVLQQNSLNFDLSVEEIFPALLSGATLVPSERLFGMDSESRPTFVHLTAAHWHTLVAEWERSPDKAREQLAGVRLLNVTGDALSPQKLQAWEALCPDKQTKLVNTYGPTEATVSCTAAYVKHNPEMASVTIGKPMANTRIYFLDAQGEPVPIGVAGELHVAGDGVARGYLNRPELTAERFIKDPFSHDPEARLYKTGDLGRWLADGSIEFLGRNDFQVKVRGFRIELGEIEARLAEHPAVRETAVLAREDGPGSKKLVAYYTGDADVTVDRLRAHLAETLPEYMVPAAFVHLEALPLTPNGKLDRKALPAPEGDAYAVRGYEAPQGETEQALAALWAELLKIEQVGRHDNFFELGGHSLLAVTLIARMRQAGLNTDVRELFAAPTLAGLAALADHGSHAEQLVVPANRIPAGCTAITPDLLPLVSLSQADIDRITAAVPGGAANVQDIYPLAPLQEGILFHHLMDSEGDAYLMPVLMAFDTHERLDGFLRALQAVIARHDILRTSMAWEGLPEPVQVVWRTAKLAIEDVILDPEANDAAEQLAERYDPRHYRLDVRAAPMINGFIAYDLREGRWLLLLLAHHLTFDNTALDLLLEEIRMHQLGQAEQLPAPLPFRNFVAQARLGMAPEEHEAFFREMLADVDEPTAPFGLLDVQGNGSGIEEAKQDLDLDLARRLRDQARSLGISAASLFHLAWASVLSRTSGRDDVVFGTVLLGRMQGGEGAERVLGMFINTLPLRVQLAQGSVLEQIREVQDRLAGLLRHEHAPLSLAQRCSGVQAPAPLFSALLNYRHSQDDASADSATAWLGIEILSSGEERSNYPIVLSVDDLGEGFLLSAQTLSPAAPERLCALMHTALDNLITALENAPDTAMRRIGVLPEAERRQVLYDWNATRADYPKDRCVHELFEAQVARTPEADAVVWDGGRLSYAELNARANRLAHHLIGLGVNAGDYVALLIERSADLIAAELAVLKCGAAYVPLDPDYPVERLAFMIEDCAAKIVLAGKDTELADAVCVRIETALAHQTRDDNPDLPLHSQLTAYVMYTSGSTGQPKGVEIPHRAIGRLVLNNGYAEIGPSDRVAFAANPAFDATTFEVWAPLLNGGCTVVVDQTALLEPEHFEQILRQYGVTALWLTVGLFNQYADTLSAVFSQLRYLLVGGDSLDPRIISRVVRSNPPQHLLNGYGPTETTTFAATYEITAVREGARSIPIGRPIANTRIYLLDAQGEPVPVGVAGEIHVAGDGVARGYLNRPELTAERFLADPFSNDPQARMYKTGDLGRWLTDGAIEFLGRNDFQVKVRGFRIELGEIEAKLAACAGVHEAVVIVREDHPGDKRLVAYLTAMPDADLNIDDLRMQLKEVLPEYMVPGAIMILDALPLTPNGKLDRKALPVPDVGALQTQQYEAPQGDLEEALAAIWQDILGIDRVGRHDHFFELGGHSLLAVQMITRIRQGMGCELALRDLFDHPVLQDLARQLQQSDANTLAPIERADRSQPLPLSFAQQRLWFIAQMEGASEAYHIAGG
ncbi:non-ribosomal peptide synthetase, partial [Methylobacter luteus]|uniref:non-ribosomal peptide synthetase n=1 Tax=Methylobacter luteus TaxID=415 RepID=UPI000685E941